MGIPHPVFPVSSSVRALVPERLEHKLAGLRSYGFVMDRQAEAGPDRKGSEGQSADHGVRRPDGPVQSH